MLTDTATVHAAAWKKLFDDFIRRRPQAKREQFRPFDIQVDYCRYVDGKPRHDGVVSFLKSRGRAQARKFVPGQELDDWLAAERENHDVLLLTVTMEGST